MIVSKKQKQNQNLYQNAPIEFSWITKCEDNNTDQNQKLFLLIHIYHFFYKHLVNKISINLQKIIIFLLIWTNQISISKCYIATSILLQEILLILPKRELG